MLVSGFSKERRYGIAYSACGLAASLLSVEETA